MWDQMFHGFPTKKNMDQKKTQKTKGKETIFNEIQNVSSLSHVDVQHHLHPATSSKDDES